MILHTINKSPGVSTSLQTCLKLAGSEDVILLIEDGVYGALSLADKDLTGHSIYALQEDLQARGLVERINTNVKALTYKDFVELSLQCLKVQAWS